MAIIDEWVTCVMHSFTIVLSDSWVCCLPGAIFCCVCCWTFCEESLGSAPCASCESAAMEMVDG